MRADRILWASDFPHSDGTYPHTAKIVDELIAPMSREDAQRILSRNTAALYGLAA
jgi:predicted TIM-barrel fold metal-dependent hydrolase